jgi:hypothetical protein
MDWKLVFQLSLFGAAMAIATVYWIPSNVEPFFWIVILGVTAYLIARRAGGCEAEMVAGMGSPRLVMAATGPVIELISGCIIGLVALGLTRLLAGRAQPAIPAP